jgi:hypothetical protein
LSIESKGYWSYPIEYFEIWNDELTITPEYIKKTMCRFLKMMEKLLDIIRWSNSKMTLKRFSMGARVSGFCLAVLTAFAPTAWSQSVQGTVFEDTNKNGIRETGELGIAGVVVSNQVDCVVTGDDGSYTLDVGRGYGIVFVRVPADHRAVGRFWKQVPADTTGSSLDFALAPTPVMEEFTFIHASDTHLKEQTLPRLRRVREIVKERQPAFVLITGDLIDDALRVPEEAARGLYELYLREIETFEAPVYSVLGNHEIFGIERHMSLVSKEHPLYGKNMYRHYLGPNYYSFQFGKVHFIGLDVLDYDDLWYYGHVEETELGWLEQDLSHVPEGTTVVTFSHVPFFSSVTSLLGYSDDRFVDIDGKRSLRHAVSNTVEVLSRLSKHRHTLALTGHLHTREKIELGTATHPTRFHQAPAVRDASSHPNELSGVILYRVQGEEVDDGEFIPLDPSNGPSHR